MDIEQINNNQQLANPNQGISNQRRPFRCRCIRSRCCGYTLFTKYIDPVLKQERQLLVPLQDVTIKGVLEAGHAILDV